MSMTKKEIAEYEGRLELGALRYTNDVDTDVPPPTYESKVCLSKGFTFMGETSDWPRVEVACSSFTGHGTGQTNQTTSQRPIALYSTRLRALRALRREVEKYCARTLRRVDKMIEDEEIKSAGLAKIEKQMKEEAARG